MSKEEIENEVRNTIRYYCGGNFEDAQFAAVKIISFMNEINNLSSPLNSDEELNNILP